MLLDDLGIVGDGNASTDIADLGSSDSGGGSSNWDKFFGLATLGVGLASTFAGKSNNAAKTPLVKKPPSTALASNPLIMYAGIGFLIVIGAILALRK